MKGGAPCGSYNTAIPTLGWLWVPLFWRLLPPPPLHQLVHPSPLPQASGTSSHTDTTHTHACIHSTKRTSPLPQPLLSSPSSHPSPFGSAADRQQQAAHDAQGLTHQVEQGAVAALAGRVGGGLLEMAPGRVARDVAVALGQHLEKGKGRKKSGEGIHTNGRDRKDITPLGYRARNSTQQEPANVGRSKKLNGIRGALALKSNVKGNGWSLGTKRNGTGPRDPRGGTRLASYIGTRGSTRASRFMRARGTW